MIFKTRIRFPLMMMVTMGSLVPLCSSFLWTPQPWHPYTTTASSSSSRSSSGATELYMGKGLNKQKNKQMDLKRKMELAKLQKQGIDTDADTDAAASAENDSKLGLTQEEIKERNDRRRFEQLLQREGTKMFSDYESDGYLNTKQVEEEISAQRSSVDRIFEGDPAPTDCFEHLVDSTTEHIVAKKGAGRLAPWTSKDYSVDSDDYRVVICDPRKQSDELHRAIKDLQGALPKDMKDRLYYINADTPAENRRWLKKNGLAEGKVDIYCDNEDLDWMRSYTALGENRFSMTMFIIAKGKVMKLARDVDIYNVARTVTNAVKSMKKEQSLYD